MRTQTADPGDDRGGSRTGRGAITIWRSEVDAMYDRMQTPEFAAAVQRALDEPLRVQLPAHLRRTPE